MQNTICLRNTKDSTAKLNESIPMPSDKLIWVDPSVLCYKTEDGDKTEELNEEEILVIHNSSLVAKNQNLVKRRFRWIKKFDYEGPIFFKVMRDLALVVFEHLDITSKLYLYIRIKYKERILTGPIMKKYHVTLLVCKETYWVYAVDKWILGSAKYMSMENNLSEYQIVMCWRLIIK